MRTKGKNIDSPAERFHAKCKVFANFFSKGNIRVTVADVDSITNIYNASDRPPTREDVIRVAATVTIANSPSHMGSEVIRCIQQFP